MGRNANEYMCMCNVFIQHLSYVSIHIIISQLIGAIADGSNCADIAVVLPKT